MDSVPPLLASVLADSRTKHILKGQVILYEGDLPAEVYVIKSGIVKVHDIDESGNEKILHLMKLPALIPFAFFPAGVTPTRWFYTALTDCELYALPRHELRVALRADTELSMYFMNWFSHEVHEILTRLSSLGKTNVRDKLVAALKFLVICHSIERRSGWWRASFPVSHQLLADMVGITRESAALTMRELQAEGLVRNPRVTILEINFRRLLV